MSAVAKFVGFALHHIIGQATPGVEDAIECVQNYFTDHRQTLAQAVARANDRAWHALGIALAGDGFLEQLRVLFASGDDKGIRRQVQQFLASRKFELPDDFRRLCLTELQRANQQGALAAKELSPHEIRKEIADQTVFSLEPLSLMSRQIRANNELADDLAPEFPNLAKLLRMRDGNGPPMLFDAFTFFFRREIETDPELARGLNFLLLYQLPSKIDAGFEQLKQALNSLGENIAEVFQHVFAQLDRIEVAVRDIHANVLDLHVELQRFGTLQSASQADQRQLLQKVLDLVNRAGMEKGEVKLHQSFSIRSDEERQFVKQLLARFRALPEDQQAHLPALLNGLGKLQYGSGDFNGASSTFLKVSQQVSDPAAQAEAQYNAYRAALEVKDWDGALQAICRAAELAPERFSPFPLDRYQPKEILGAGGFGAAFRCHDHNFDEEVVVKTLHDAALERNLTDVFREARLLKTLNHAAIIGVQDCNFADPKGRARPYLVMEYFPGQTLEAYLHQHGAISPEEFDAVALQIVQGMQAAHNKGILHRDLKPANVLVRNVDGAWEVKIIDFGLAMRKSTIETSIAARAPGNTLLTDSVAGTVEYAPPEQLGKLPGVPPGTYSDVYSFAKLCCRSLFQTTEPRMRHWQQAPGVWADLLEPCLEQTLELRTRTFDPVVTKLVNSRQQVGEAALKQAAEQVFQRSQGSPTAADSQLLTQTYKKYQIPQSRAQQIVNAAKKAWLDARPAAQAVVTTLAPAPVQPKLQPGDTFTNSLPPKPVEVPAAGGAENSAGDLRSDNTLGMKLVWCPAGRFTMGSPASETGHCDDEEQVEVTLTEGFWLGQTGVTQSQFKFVMGSEPWSGNGFVKKGPNYPATYVDWNDATEFCKRLTESEIRAGRLPHGWKYDLPTEAQREYATRAGTTTAYHFGNDAGKLSNYAWFDKNADEVGEKYAHEVGAKKPNAWGLYDMHGNVWEWCRDYYADKLPGGVDPFVGTGSYRVYRGGSWSSKAVRCRSAYRNRDSPGYRYSSLGFRLALVPSS